MTEEEEEREDDLPLWDLARSRKDRDEAIEMVVGNAGLEFRAGITKVLSGLPTGTLITGEGFRIKCLAEMPAPHHHNAWGGTVAGLVRSGRLVGTGMYESMTSVKSHARKTQIYRVGHHEQPNPTNPS